MSHHSPPPFSDAELHAYVDGALPDHRHTAVTAYLTDHPEAAATVRSYQEQNLKLKTLFRPVLHEPIPKRLLQAARAPAEHSATANSWLPTWSLQRLAAGVLIATVSGSAGWVANSLHRSTEPTANQAQSSHSAQRFAHQAAIAHVVYSPDIRRPVEIGAEQEDQLVTWLSNRLNAEVQPPKLGAMGFELIGGRLLPGVSGPVAQFMYHNAQGQRLTLYVSSESKGTTETAFRFTQEGPVNVFYWVDQNFGYAISAGIEKPELAHVATAVYEQLANRK
ncbi:anti-sigma factor family protein [Azospira sp. APE16]|uniref:anti-sigma factor family protein n=1 Tax=Azospira sp. APE16 TaxID=3394231 RepID=UPI003A4D319C